MSENESQIKPQSNKAIVAVWTKFPDDSMRNVLVAVSPGLDDSDVIDAAIREHYPNAEAWDWRQVGTTAEGLDAKLVAFYGLANAEKLYESDTP